MPTPSPSPEATPSVEEESSSPEQPPWSRRKQASTSREEAPPEYDVTRFTSLENQEQYDARLLKEIIIEKHLASEVDAHYKVLVHLLDLDGRAFFNCLDITILTW